MFQIFKGEWRGIGATEEQIIYLNLGVKFRKYLHCFKGAKLHVLIALALHMDEQGLAYPSYDLLVAETGYNRSTIAQALEDLCQTDIEGQRILLRWRERNDQGQFAGSNRYKLFPTANELSQEDAQPELENPTVGKSNGGKIQPEVTPAFEETPKDEEARPTGAPPATSGESEPGEHEGESTSLLADATTESAAQQNSATASLADAKPKVAAAAKSKPATSGRNGNGASLAESLPPNPAAPPQEGNVRRMYLTRRCYAKSGNGSNYGEAGRVNPGWYDLEWEDAMPYQKIVGRSKYIPTEFLVADDPNNGGPAYAPAPAVPIDPTAVGSDEDGDDLRANGNGHDEAWAACRAAFMAAKGWTDRTAKEDDISEAIHEMRALGFGPEAIPVARDHVVTMFAEVAKAKGEKPRNWNCVTLVRHMADALAAQEAAKPKTKLMLVRSGGREFLAERPVTTR